MAKIISPAKSQPSKLKVTSKSEPVVVKQPELKTVKYSHSNLKVSPRKLRLLVATVKKISPQTALAKLQFTNSNAARLLADVLKNAVNTAVKNHKLIAESLKFSSVTVDEGQKIKRMDKSHGSRFARGVIIKRHSRLNIVLSGTIAS